MTAVFFQPLLRSTTLALAAAALAVPLLSGCAPLLLGGAMMGTGMVVTDRRTAGTQFEDEAIEVKAGTRVRELLGERGHVSVTSYNRLVLITGEVQNDADRSAVDEAVARVENVRATVNELAVMGASSIGSRTNDAVLTSKVKATFIDAKDLQSNVFKVVAERGNIYLMGRVTEREASRAASLARSVSGVAKVIRVVEVISDAELATLSNAK
jgi:osmotically-inducible protein OsmY